MSLGKPVIKMVLMEDEMKDFAIYEAQKALDTSNSEKVTPSPHSPSLTSLVIVSCFIHEINI